MLLSFCKSEVNPVAAAAYDSLLARFPTYVNGIFAQKKGKKGEGGETATRYSSSVWQRSTATQCSNVKE